MARGLSGLDALGLDDAEGPSSVQAHAALGGHASAPRQLEEGCRWVGGQPTEICGPVIQRCAEGTESGKIVDLNFHFKFIPCIQGLQEFASHLRNLDLSSNNIRSMEGLEGLKALKELKLYSCQIGRIACLEKCTSLAALHLEDNCISAVEGLDTLRSLEYLNLDKNRIAKLGRGLSKLSKLKELHLSLNQLKSLEGLLGLGSLEVLCAADNQITEVTQDHLKGLGKLDELRLEGNALERLAFLCPKEAGAVAPLPNLATLDVSGNRLTTAALRSLPVLPEIAELGLARNRIEGIPENFASSLPSLEILDVGGNLLSAAVDVERLKALTSLRELLLEGNPCTSQPEELQKALAQLGPLEFLDDQPVPVKDAEEAEDKSFLTTTKALTNGDEAAPKALMDGQASGTLALALRPSTASRPGTSSGRPGTAQSMKEAGVQQPLMHARMKVSEKRFAAEDQAKQWEMHTSKGLAAIEQQIRKTEQLADANLEAMDRNLRKAQKIIDLGAKLQAQGLLDADGQKVGPTTPRAEEPGPLPDRTPLISARSRRMRDAVKEARWSPEPMASPPPEPQEPKVPSPVQISAARQLALRAACDEEIEEVPEASGSEPADEEPAPAEVEEEILRSRSPAPSPPPVELRVEERAAIRRARKDGSRGPVKRPGSRDLAARGGYSRGPATAGRGNSRGPQPGYPASPGAKATPPRAPPPPSR